MAMTGNHYAMATADTVFIKDRVDGTNIHMSVYLKPGDNSDSESEADTRPGAGIMDEAANALCLTSNLKSLEDLYADDTRLKASVHSNVLALRSQYNPFHRVLSHIWQPVIYTPDPESLLSQVGSTWEKTIGVTLPTLSSSSVRSNSKVDV